MMKFFGGKKGAAGESSSTEPETGADEAPKPGFFAA
jgi:hypothetical protein